jgi:glycosyltransferase involved in cell wall biosynthesis
MLTSSHDIFDNRIYYKEALSLKKYYDDIWIIAPGDKDFTTKDGIKVKCFKRRTSWHDRIRPMKDMYKLGVQVGADIYHAHEPDSFQVALKLKKNIKKKAIYDSHEYYPEAFSEHFKGFSPIAKKMLHLYEKRMSQKADMIISVNDILVDKFKGYNSNVVLLPNYPIFDDKTMEKVYRDKPVFVYVGEQREDRGIMKILEAIKLTKVEASFIFVGRFINEAFKAKVQEYIAANLTDKDIKFVGKVPHLEVFDYLSYADAGLVILQPNSWRYVNSEPIKLFEYMLSKTVVIGSDFPMIKNIVGKANCGFTVKPEQPADIAKTMDYVSTHRDEIVKMGDSGYQDAMKNYNWLVLEKRLVEAYKAL